MYIRKNEYIYDIYAYVVEWKMNEGAAAGWLQVQYFE